MKALLKVTLIIAAVFASTFLFAKLFGILNVEQVQGWLNKAHNTSNMRLLMVVIALLFADLFIAVPTLTICILSGYFLGFALGALAALIGMMCAGVSGYWLSRYYGEAFLCRLLKAKHQRQQLKTSFAQHGFVMILLSRAMPILPEVCACLAGLTKMRFNRFLLAWGVVSVPYVLIATFSGSISSISNPKPAIFTAIGLSALFTCGWIVFKRKYGVRLEG